MRKVSEKSKPFLFCLKYPFKTAPMRYCLYLLLNIVNALLPATKIMIWKVILDTLQNTNIESLDFQFLILLFSALVVSSVGIGLVQNIKGFIESSIIDKAQLSIDVEIMEKLSELDAAYYDNPENRDTLDLVKNSKMMICEGILWPVKIIQSMLTFASVTSVFLFISPILAIVYLAAAVPQAISTARLEKLIDQEEIEAIPDARKRDYYRDILVDKVYAKETRIYNSKGFFFSRYKLAWAGLAERKSKIYGKQFRKLYRNELIHTIGSVAVIATSLVQAVQGYFSVGDISVVLNATKSSYAAFNDFFSALSHFANITAHRVNMYLHFISATTNMKNGQLKNIDRIREIAFVDVSFKYPLSKENTLTNISFVIKAGAKNALVGKNGEGKSTIIKLLLRLYDPSEGTILVNGIDIKEYDIVELRKVFSLCFQDVTKYALTVSENVAFSGSSYNDLVDNALRFAGISEIVEAFPKRLSTELTREFSDEGQELSGGQWQKLSIARAIYREAEFLVLDEPSSALDPIEEDRIMDLLASMGEGKTTIVVSHRLSDLRSYDQIVVIDNGTVAEIGTHNELLSNNALYARMYILQSEKYKRKEVQNEKA